MLREPAILACSKCGFHISQLLPTLDETSLSRDYAGDALCVENLTNFPAHILYMLLCNRSHLPLSHSREGAHRWMVQSHDLWNSNYHHASLVNSVLLLLQSDLTSSDAMSVKNHMHCLPYWLAYHLGSKDQYSLILLGVSCPYFAERVTGLQMLPSATAYFRGQDLEK